VPVRCQTSTTFAHNHQEQDGKMPAATPSERALIARIAAHERWASTTDRAAATPPGRKGLIDRFDRQVDPDGTMPPAERARRSASARKAFYSRLALKSAQDRRARSLASQLEDEHD